MEQHVIIECWSCRLVHPGEAKCGVCGGRGTIRHAARMGDASVSHSLMKEALEAADATKSGLKRYDAFVNALIHWQIYGVAYVGVAHKVVLDTPDFTREHQALRDRLVAEIRRVERDL